jgi:hypothetical protein
MLCATQTAAYVCSDASGTTCAKVAVQLAVINVTQVSPCPTAGLVVVSGQDWADVADYASLLNISSVQGGQIALAIMLVWAVGWAFRMVIRAINSASDGVIVSQD